MTEARRRRPPCWQVAPPWLDDYALERGYMRDSGKRDDQGEIIYDITDEGEEWAQRMIDRGIFTER